MSLVSTSLYLLFLPINEMIRSLCIQEKKVMHDSIGVLNDRIDCLANDVCQSEAQIREYLDAKKTTRMEEF